MIFCGLVRLAAILRTEIITFYSANQYIATASQKHRCPKDALARALDALAT